MAFNILVGKNGPNEQKLSCLIKQGFKCAIAAIARQEAAFDQLIKEITALKTDHIAEGNVLKKANISYYTAVKSLQTFERQEIAQQQISIDKTNSEKIRDEAIRKQGQLLKEKLKMYTTTVH